MRLDTHVRCCHAICAHVRRGDGRWLTRALDAPAAAREMRNAGAVADEVRNTGEGEGAVDKHSGFNAAALQGIPPAAAARGALVSLHKTALGCAIATA